MSEIEQRRLQMAEKHAEERKALRGAQQKRWQAEILLRQECFNKGLRGWLDRLTGKHRRIKEQNEQETYQSRERDQKEKDALIFEQLGQSRVLQGRIERLEQLSEKREDSLSRDIVQYEEIRGRKREVVEFKQRFHSRPSLGAPGRER